MRNTGSQTLSGQRVTFYIFVMLILAVPLVLYRGFDNSLELVKLETLKIIGGIFIISCSFYLIFKAPGKDAASTALIFDKNLDSLMLFFVVAAILSTLFSIDIQASYSGTYERQIGLVVYLYLFLIYMLLPYVVQNKNRLRTVMLAVEIMGVVVALMCVFEYAGFKLMDLRPRGFKRPVSTVGHPIFSAGFMVLIFPFSALNVSSKKSRILRFAAPAVIAAGIVTTQTRAAYTAFAVEIILIILLHLLTSGEKGPKLKKNIVNSSLMILGFLALCVFLVLLFPDNVFIKRLLSIGKISEQPRWLLWRDSISMFLSYPVTGTGIAAFSRAFENFASYELRYSEIKVYFDNAHSNFLNAFCTMGVIGGVTYILLLFQVLSLSYRNLVSRKNPVQLRSFSLAVLSFVCGYMVFGIADFDDISILFYFFVLLSMFKIALKSYGKKDQLIREAKLKRSVVNSIALTLVVFSLYNIYKSFEEISAQNFFSRGIERYSAGDINGFVSDVNNAIRVNPDETYYRYEFASRINIYCSGLTQNEAATKLRLLQEAKQQVIKAEADHSSYLNCLALRSLIELGLGNEKEAFRVKDELFKIDSTQVSYRINLAVYYMNQNNYDAALKELNTVLAWDIKNVNAYTAKVMYFLRTGNNYEAERTCKELLVIEPGNSFAERTLKELNARE